MGLCSEKDTGVDRPSIQDDGTGAAFSRLADALSARESLSPKDGQQCLIRLAGDIPLDSVDCHTKVHHLGVIIPSSVTAERAWCVIERERVKENGRGGYLSRFTENNKKAPESRRTASAMQPFVDVPALASAHSV